jgi:hypothetical protein
MNLLYAGYTLMLQPPTFRLESSNLIHALRKSITYKANHPPILEGIVQRVTIPLNSILTTGEGFAL